MPSKKKSTKASPSVPAEWPSRFPRHLSTAKADAVSRFADADRARGLGLKTVDSMFRRLEGMNFVVKEAGPDYAVAPRVKTFAPGYDNPNLGVRLYHADAFELMESVAYKCPEGCVDLIVTDPPYFLSNDGITCVAGRMVSVNKGEWDRSRGIVADHEFTKEWLNLCRNLLKPNGTIWVTGTLHIIYNVGFAMQELGYKILNDVIWWKTNPAPHLACRYLQHATETVLWARKSDKAKHLFHYDMMKKMNGGRQMQNVWRFPTVPRQEKALGGHPTQKPVALMKRIIECCTNPGDLVFDPFMGAGTTGVASAMLGRRFVGSEIDKRYFDIAMHRIDVEAETCRQYSIFPPYQLNPRHLGRSWRN